MNVICLSFLATVFYLSKDSISICGYSWQRSTASNKPSPLSTNLCACPAGTYCPSGTLAASTPVTCTAGSYCAKGSTATAPCPSGHYCSSPSSLVPCPAGVVQWFGFGFVNMIGYSSCVFCLVIQSHATRLVAVLFHETVDIYGLEGYD